MTANATADDRPMRVRMAPSPTGPLHIGTARTSLYNYLTARHFGGTYVLRIEDTDTARSTADYERDIIDGLHWLGISWDEGPQVAGGADVGAHGPYRQSERMDRYAAEVDRLLVAGSAYRCWCTPDELEAVRREQEARREPPRYNRRCLNLSDTERAAFEAAGRPSVIRFRVDPDRVRFDDLIRGEVEFDNALLGDFVIVRADGVPLYHLCVVVDDEAMEITHVIRGEDHLSNTPKHIALIRALGYREPRFGHIPLILNPDRSKLSKRKVQTGIGAYRAEGYLPDALVNFMAFLGWSPGTEEEVFTLDELVERFDIGRVHKGGAIFDAERLDHLNGVYLRRLSDDSLALHLRPWIPAAVADEDLRRIVPLVKERLVRLSDAADLVDFLWEPDDAVAARYEAGLLAPRKGTPDDARRALEIARESIGGIDPADFAADHLETVCRSAAAAAGMRAGDFFSPMRVAVTGRTVSPPLFDSLELLGRDRSLARIEAALGKLAAVPA
jgi:glutamyl-tRNA synthetase